MGNDNLDAIARQQFLKNNRDYMEFMRAGGPKEGFKRGPKGPFKGNFLCTLGLFEIGGLRRELSIYIGPLEGDFLIK